MPWLRAHSRRLAVIALCAMVLQAVAAFGHTHLPHGGIASKQAVAGFASKLPIATVVEASVSKAQLPPGGDPDVACAICLAGSLVASAVVSDAPALVLPVAYLLLGPPPVLAVESHNGVRTAFWSRGPPVS